MPTNQAVPQDENTAFEVELYISFELGDKSWKVTARVHSCYEAGRDGWWLHRWLTGQGIDNVVVDAASIEVNRCARQPKNDRLDGDKHARHAQAPSRRRARLDGAARALLVLHNVRLPVIIGGRDWARWWANHRE